MQDWGAHDESLLDEVPNDMLSFMSCVRLMVCLIIGKETLATCWEEAPVSTLHVCVWAPIFFLFGIQWLSMLRGQMLAAMNTDETDEVDCLQAPMTFEFDEECPVFMSAQDALACW